MQKEEVQIIACPAYGAGAQAAVREVVAALGGMRHFIEPGQQVILKPNLLTDRTPEEAVTTHPDIVEAAIKLVREAGGTPIVADSPANAAKLQAVWERTGIGALCERTGTPLLSLEESGSRAFESGGYSFHIAKPLLEADAIINLPKAKTHVLTTLTAAVKNLYGAVPGYHKTQLHARHPKPADFAKLLREIHACVKPVLNIADGIVGMEGDGPSGGRPVPLGVVAAATDAYALDAALCQIMGLPLRAVPYLHRQQGRAHDAPLFCTVGDTPIPQHRVRRPRTMAARLVPEWLGRLVAQQLWVRPAFSEACIRCGRCIKACPTAALALPPATGVPELAPTRCIGCCCCHEVCPVKAIDMTTGPLLRLLRRKN